MDSSGNQHPMEWCDLELWQHGEGGVPPEDFAFRIKAGEKLLPVLVIEHLISHKTLLINTVNVKWSKTKE